MYTRTAFVPQEVRAEAAVPVRTRRNGHLFPPQSWIRRRQFRSTGARGVQTLPVAFSGSEGSVTVAAFWSNQAFRQRLRPTHRCWPDYDCDGVRRT